MESFGTIKRRTTGVFESAKQSMPSVPSMPPMPSMPSMPSLPSFPSMSVGNLHKKKHNNNHAMKGTWEHIAVPPLPRSSHSLSIVNGTAYVFGGEVEPRHPVDNAMHVINLPFSSAPADYYAIQATAAKNIQPAIDELSRPLDPDVAAEDEPKQLERTDSALDEVPLVSPVQAENSTSDGESTPASSPSDKGKSKGKGKGKGKGKEIDRGTVPAPRVGHASAVVGTRLFVFGGRGGPDMTPLEEHGRVWVFDTRTHLWSYLDPASAADPASPEAPASLTKAKYPAARSYHSAVAVEKPREFRMAPRHPSTWRDWAAGDSGVVGTPQHPIIGNIAASARDEESDGYGTLIVHGGCLAGGGRTNDTWAFDVRSRTWAELPTAPGKARGGAALCVSRSRLYRFGGFNGDTQEGGDMSYLELGVEQFDDASGRGEAALCARGGWQTLVPGGGPGGAEQSLTAPDEWPGHRSVAGLQAVTTGAGREYLVLLLGERTRSDQGHEGAGSFWGDVWAFQVPSDAYTAASAADRLWGALGWKSGEGRWRRVEMGPYDDDDDVDHEGPGARGWIASASMAGLEENGIVVWGGLDASNSRLGDGWIMRLD